METTKTNNQPKKVKNRSTMPAELTLTGIVLGYITSGLLGGASEMHLVKLSTSTSHWVGALLITYVIVGTAAVIHLGVKFLLKKG